MIHNRVLGWEAHLIKRASKGESVAFALLAEEYRPTLRAIAMRMLRSPDDAADAVQDTLLKAYKALPDFDYRRPIKPWLCRICANCCVDIVRSRRRDCEPLEPFENVLSDEHSDFANEIEDADALRALRAAIARLPKPYRTIIEMRHFKDMEVNEIALALNRPEGTVKSWLFRARALLRTDMGAAPT